MLLVPQDGACVAWSYGEALPLCFLLLPLLCCSTTPTQCHIVSTCPHSHHTHLFSSFPLRLLYGPPQPLPMPSSISPPRMPSYVVPCSYPKNKHLQRTIVVKRFRYASCPFRSYAVPLHRPNATSSVRARCTPITILSPRYSHSLVHTIPPGPLQPRAAHSNPLQCHPPPHCHASRTIRLSVCSVEL